MKIYLEIGDRTEPKVFEGVTKEGRPFKIVAQTDCYLHDGSRHPMPCDLPVGDDGKSYPAGFYDIEPGSLIEILGRGRLGVKRGWKLRPVDPKEIFGVGKAA